MIDTPNQGSRLAFVSGFPKRDECVLADTVNLRELQPTSGFSEGAESPGVAVLGGGALDHFQQYGHR